MVQNIEILNTLKNIVTLVKSFVMVLIWYYYFFSYSLFLAVLITNCSALKHDYTCISCVVSNTQSLYTFKA